MAKLQLTPIGQSRGHFDEFHKVLCVGGEVFEILVPRFIAHVPDISKMSKFQNMGWITQHIYVKSAVSSTEYNVRTMVATLGD